MINSKKLDHIIENKIRNMIHVNRWLTRAVLPDDACRNAHGNTMARQICHHYRACPHFAACAHVDWPKHAHSRTQQHTVACVHSVSVKDLSDGIAPEINAFCQAPHSLPCPHCQALWNPNNRNQLAAQRLRVIQTIKNCSQLNGSSTSQVTHAVHACQMHM